MSKMAAVVFLFDVDNTLLDNDAAVTDDSRVPEIGPSWRRHRLQNVQTVKALSPR
jgi:FMN phosphatase YigB (HAD superfamily)